MNSPALKYPSLPEEEITLEVQALAEVYHVAGRDSYTSGHPDRAEEGHGEVFEATPVKAWNHRTKRFESPPAGFWDYFDPAQIEQLARQQHERGRQ